MGTIKESYLNESYMKMSLPHGKTKTEATERLKDHSPKLISSFGSNVSDIQQEWQDNNLIVSFRILSFDVHGRLSVGEETVELDVSLPFIARPLERTLREKVTLVMQEIFEQ